MQTKNAYSYLRFSTPEQSLGDSERRQLEAAKAYCASHGLRLVDTIADKGVSGYHGKNHVNGALGRLLKAMKRGNVLLLEDVDRFSREQPLDAMNRLQAAVKAGIEVHILRTGQKITAANFNDAATLIPAFFGSFLASQESAKKAERVKAAWEGKRQALAAGQAVQLGCSPRWLRWDKDKAAYTLDVAKAATVKAIFEQAAAGAAVVDIVRGLKDVPPTAASRKHEWNASYVRSLLRNRAVLGWCSAARPPMKLYPPVVDEATYYAVQARRPGVGSRAKARTTSPNLFPGLAFCSACGEPVVCQDIGHGYGHGLVCSGSRSGRSDCRSHNAPLAVIEAATLAFLADADAIRPLLASQSAGNRLDELEGRLDAARKQVAKLLAVIIDDPQPSPAIYSALKAAEADGEAATAALEAERERVRAERPAALAYADFVASLPSLAKDASQRPALRHAIGRVVEKLTLNPKAERLADGSKVWNFVIHLRGGIEPVAIDAGRHGSSSRSLRPLEYVKDGENVVPLLAA